MYRNKGNNKLQHFLVRARTHTHTHLSTLDFLNIITASGLYWNYSQRAFYKLWFKCHS